MADNLVTVLGRLGKSPEKTVINDKTVCKFSLAEDVFTGKDANGKPTKVTIWYDVIVWNGLVEQAAALAKGQEVVVRGKLAVKHKDEKTYRDLTAYVIRLADPLPDPEPSLSGDDDAIPF